MHFLHRKILMPSFRALQISCNSGSVRALAQSLINIIAKNSRELIDLPCAGNNFDHAGCQGL